MIAIFIDINVLSTLFQRCFTTVFSDDTWSNSSLQPLSVPIAIGLTAYAVLNLLFYWSTFMFKCAHNCNFSVSPIGLKFAIFTVFIQEGQHPLTGQRAPPISGGTYRRRRTLIDGYLESPFPTACLL